MTGHTPGPWAYSAIAGDHSITTKHQYRPGERLAPVICDVNPDLEEYEANVQLIVSAPELLYALKTLAGEVKQLRLNVRKDFHLMNAHAYALKVIDKVESNGVLA